ncbi:SPOR domain-containing protein [Spirochaetota bacterium]
MQNIDFYNGNYIKNNPSDFDRMDPEYYSRVPKNSIKHEVKSNKKASRLIFLIVALCIICFTTGLALGIKFAGGSKREIIDSQTFNAVTGIKKKVSNLIHEKEIKNFKKKHFPKNTYPYVIKVGGQHSPSKSKIIAKNLSKMGHTVILSKRNSLFRIYLGPFKRLHEARGTLKKIVDSNDKLIASNVKIFKRK